MMDITNLDDHRKVWKTDAAACAACGHEWQAVYPVGAEDVGLECPACKSGLGSVLPSKDIVERLRELSTWDMPELKYAAYEIERLRQLVHELNSVAYVIDGHGVAHRSFTIVYKELE